MSVTQEGYGFSLGPIRGYRVLAHGLEGNGATPGLALRDLWRQAERLTLAGRSGFSQMLPERRRDSLRKRAQRSVPPSGEQEQAQ